MLGGILGTPLGVEVLRHLAPHIMAGLYGGFLTVLAILLLIVPIVPRLTISGWTPALVTGWLGGIVGGFSAFPGSVPTAYLAYRHTGKDATRGAIQPFILSMQVLSLSLLMFHQPQAFNSDFAFRCLVCVPAVLAGTSIGVRFFLCLNDGHFRHLVLVALAASGMALVIKSLLA